MECNTLEYLYLDFYPANLGLSFGYQSTLPKEEGSPNEIELPVGYIKEEVQKRRIGFI